MTTHNICKACGESAGDPKGPLASKHYCKSESLAARYGGSERTYRNVVGHVEGWAEWQPCSVCRSRDVVAHRATGLSDRVWCAAHVGKNKGTKHPNPFAPLVLACYPRWKE